MKWLNDLNTVSFSSFTNQLLWLATAIHMQYVAHWCIAHGKVDWLVASVPFWVMWLGFLTGKSGITAIRDAVKRNTDVGYVEAKERGKVAGAAAAAVIAETALDAKAARANGHTVPSPVPTTPSPVNIEHAETVQAAPTAPAQERTEGMDDSRRDDESGPP